MLRRASRFSFGSSMALPRRVPVPLVGCVIPRSILMVVLLPAPLRPRKPVICCALTFRSSASTAANLPKRLVSWWVSMTRASDMLSGPRRRRAGVEQFCLEQAADRFFGQPVFLQRFHEPADPLLGETELLLI